MSILIFCLFLGQARAQDFSQFIEQAWQASPLSHGETLAQNESEFKEQSVRGRYRPQVNIEAIDTTGLPGASSDLHVGGFMGSPFRKGWAAGVSFTQNIYDFGRIRSAVEHAHAEGALSEARSAERRAYFLRSVSELYLRCAKVRLQMEITEGWLQWAQLLKKETSHFTKTGQRSIVDRALVQSEILDLELTSEDLKRTHKVLLSELGSYAAIQNCASLGEIKSLRLREDLKVDDPRIILAKAQLEIANAQVNEAKTAQLPVIQVTGSVGQMEAARLVTKEDYAAAIGLVYPIWNGGEDAKREEAAKSRASFESEILKSEQIEVDNKMRSLNESVEQHRLALKSLQENLKQVRSTMQLATKRFQQLEGPLIDVRESFRQLRSVEMQNIRVSEAYISESLELALLK